MHKRILVAYDGSENARRALNKGIEEARRSKAELRVVVVADGVVSGARARTAVTTALYKQMHEHMVEQARSFLSDALYSAKHEGVVDVIGSVEEGNPADMILAVASEQKADLIIVGRRGARGIERFLLGSVSSRVIDHAACDVLVVK